MPMIAMMSVWSASSLARRFKNDTERLEKLFALYVKMAAAKEVGGGAVGAIVPTAATTPEVNP